MKRDLWAVYGIPMSTLLENDGRFIRETWKTHERIIGEVWKKTAFLLENDLENYREIAVFIREKVGLDKRFIREFR